MAKTKIIGYYVHWIHAHDEIQATNHHLYATEAEAQVYYDREIARMDHLIKVGICRPELKDELHIVPCMRG